MIDLKKISYLLGIVVLLFSCGDAKVEGETFVQEVKKWDKITLSFNGPETSEEAAENPFLDYRLTVIFEHEDDVISIPGFYAADGKAAETSAAGGRIWQVRFRPSREGVWTYHASFRKGENISISDDPNTGKVAGFDGESGQINVVPSPGAKGRLKVAGGRYLKYTDSDEYFLKGGADSPENFLGYYDFDGTKKGEAPEHRDGEAASKAELHRYEPHLRDWKQGDPSWKNGKGKAMIGALNYLAGKQMNSVYFLTMNIAGDGKDVWPYTGYTERERFDCSKLDQWEIVFDHMDNLGLMLHIVTQETENEKLLDDGNTDFHRKLYYRELIARFAHHKGITWNLGEENGPASFSPNGQNTEQQKAMAQYLKTHDPYENYLVIHSHSGAKSKEELYTPLLGFPHIDGMSIQNHHGSETHDVTKEWIERSASAGKPWIMCMDELGPANRGIDPDDREDNNQDTMRAVVLWGNLMAGGGGVEWYFGYRNHNNDLGCEDWRSRDRLWDYTRVALEFFQDHLPFHQMASHDELISYSGDGYCLAKPGEIYAIYLPKAKTCQLDLTGQSGDYSVQWYDARIGGALVAGSVDVVPGGGLVDLGSAPVAPEMDWAIMVKKK